MNYEQMIARLEEGLTLIKDTSGDLEVMTHAYLVAVPGCNKDDYSESDIETLEQDLGWGWSDEMGWVFPCIG